MSQQIPSVSIGIPIHNGAHYLSQALNSILAQTFEDFEVVISDNASTDATQEICEQYAAKDSRIRYIRQKTNRGGAWNFNEVVRMARGKYFKWAAHDDWLAPTYLEKAVAELEASDSTVLVYPRTILVCEDPAEREFYGGHYVYYEDQMDIRHPDPFHRMSHVAKHLGLCNSVMGLFRRDTLVKTGMIRPFSGSDVVLLSETSLHGEIHELPEYLFYRRRHPGTSRLANTTREAVARWFSTDPDRPRPKLAPGWNLLWEQIKVIWKSSLPAFQRVHGILRFLATRAVRWTRTRLGRYKRRALGQDLAVRSQPVEIERHV